MATSVDLISFIHVFCPFWSTIQSVPQKNKWNRLSVPADLRSDLCLKPTVRSTASSSRLPDSSHDQTGRVLLIKTKNSDGIWSLHRAGISLISPISISRSYFRHTRRDHCRKLIRDQLTASSDHVQLPCEHLRASLQLITSFIFRQNHWQGRLNFDLHHSKIITT